MDLSDVHSVVLVIQRTISLVGTLVILSGVLIGLYQYLRVLFHAQTKQHAYTINSIRLNLARTLILGLEFIVAADLIGTTTTPDYYSLGILASIVVIRTVLNFSLNRELATLSKQS